MMAVEKGLCRIKLKSGLIAFGEIQEVIEDAVVFHGYSPSAIGKKIPIDNIEDVEYLTEEDIPPYE